MYPFGALLSTLAPFYSSLFLRDEIFLTPGLSHMLTLCLSLYYPTPLLYPVPQLISPSFSASSCFLWEASLLHKAHDYNSHQICFFSMYLSKIFFKLFVLFFKNYYLFIIYFWLCWAFVSVRGLSLVAASGGHSSSRCAGLSLSRPLLLRSTGSRRAGSVVAAHGPSCSAACGIFPDQDSNPCPPHWQADSQPLRHQGSPIKNFKVLLFMWFCLTSACPVITPYFSIRFITINMCVCVCIYIYICIYIYMYVCIYAITCF